MKILTSLFIAFLISCSALAAQSADSNGYRALQVDAGKVIGEIRSFQGLNGPPTPVMAGLPNLVEQYRALRVDQVRTHDFMGPTEIDSKYEYRNSDLSWLIPDADQRASVVRSGNASIIFPNPWADPEKPESYNFGPTDKVLAAIRATGAEVYYRVGRSWGSKSDHGRLRQRTLRRRHRDGRGNRKVFAMRADILHRVRRADILQNSSFTVCLHQGSREQPDLNRLQASAFSTGVDSEGL